MPHTKPSESQSVQDFLKAVYELQGRHERVLTNTLAEALSITAPSVTDMAGRLCTAGFLDYQKQRGVKLTDAGEQIARNVIYRHHLIERFLIEQLGYDEIDAHQEAELMEHVVSDKFVQALAFRLRKHDSD
jgi:DtxR family transcriptional regulator, Mn-dependent transcriptional regulator